MRWCLIASLTAGLALGPQLRAEGCVDINADPKAALVEIVHINETRAAEIVEGRPWPGVRALTEIRGIGASRVRDILDQGVACVGVRAAAGRRDVISGAATVLDADTFVVAGERIRLIGIDAPENDQHCHVDGRPWPCGEMATAAAEAMVGRSEITCEVFGRDRYERPLAVCRRGEVDLNDLIVREGWALAWYPSSGSVVLGPSYEAAEAEAAVHGRGIWRGQFVEPWEWRRGQR